LLGVRSISGAHGSNHCRSVSRRVT
jgi:hypothetical protein